MARAPVRRAARALGVLVPRRRVAAGGARRARRRARLRRARAHRPRRRLRLARVRARGEALRRARDHRRRGDARRRRPRDAALRDASAATRTSAGSSPTRTRGTRVAGPRARAAAGGDDASTSSPSTPRGSSASPAARGTGSASSTRTRAARLARAFPGAFYVELQRPYERGDARRNAALAELAATLGVPTVATGDVHAHHPRRARLQDALVAIRNRTSLDGCERERRGNHEIGAARARGDARAAAARRGAAHARGRRPLRVRPDAGARLPLPRLLRRRRPGRRAAARDLRARVRRALRERERAQAARATSGSTTSCALIARLGLAGFFLLHWEVLELARECALEVRGPGSPAARAAARPRPRLERRLDRLLPDRPLARRPGRGGPLARPLPQRRDGRRCPTSTSTSRATSARS